MRDIATPAGMVEVFHKLFDQPVNQAPTKEVVQLRANLIQEEAKEVLEELSNIKASLIRKEAGSKDTHAYYEHEVALLKELCDLLYVVYGTAVAFGYDIDGAFEEVHRSNMSKLGVDGRPVRREDGKALKGPNYFKANVAPYV